MLNISFADNTVFINFWFQNCSKKLLFQWFCKDCALVKIMLPLWRKPDFQESRPPSFFHFRRRFWHAQRFLTKFCQKSVPRTPLAPLWQSFGKILDPIFDQVGSWPVPKIDVKLTFSAHGASQSDVFSNFLSTFAPLSFEVAFRTDVWSVRAFKIVLPPQREHNFEKITFLKKTPKIDPPGSRFGTQKASKVTPKNTKLEKKCQKISFFSYQFSNVV